MAIQINPKQLMFIKNSLKQTFPDATIYVFGSRVKGTAKKYSDIDIAIDNKKPIPLKELSHIEEIFSESDLPILVDLVDWHRISSEFQTVIKNQYESL